MTALAGYWSLGGADPGAAVGRMLAVQEMYGGDGAVAARSGEVALGRTLHHLLPEDRYDRGPVAMPGGGLLAADLRIDNREELAEALAIDIRTMSDAQLLGRALERWGEAAVERVIGDFAFAWWDAPAQRIVLARDFMGFRPIHYHRGDGFIAFASMPKGLHAIPEIPRAPRIEALAEQLAVVPQTVSETLWEGIQRVPVASIVVIGRDGEEQRRWWQPEPRRIEFARDEDYVEALREQIDAAVRCRLRGVEGSFATHLSSGLDSTMVTATAARIADPGRVVAYTSIPSHVSPTHRSRRADEGPIASALAAMYPNVEQVFVRSGSASPFASLDRNVHLYDVHIPNLCNQDWIEAINDSARDRGIKVMLTGLFGNFSFSHAGNEYLPELFRRGRWLDILRMTPKLRRAGMRWSGIAYACVDPLLPQWVRRMIGQQNDVAGFSGLTKDAIERYRVVDRAAERGYNLRHVDWRDGFALRIVGMGRVDVGVVSKGLIAGWGLDWRHPAADRRLVEFCLSVPPRQFLLGGVPRSLLRRAGADRMPREVLDNYRIGLQASDWWVPLGQALDEARAELDRLDECAPARELLDIDRLRASLDEWPSEGWERAEVIRRYRIALLRGVATGHFIRKASGSNR